MRTWPAIAVAFLTTMAPAHAEPWTCTLIRPLTGGLAKLTVTGDGDAQSLTGTVELSTKGAVRPFGLRDGSYAWITDPAGPGVKDGTLVLNFVSMLPLGAAPAWGVTDGNIVPVGIAFYLPQLRNTVGGPMNLAGLTVVNGGAIYNTNNDWKMRIGNGVMMITNTPDAPNVAYSRELLQITATPPAEPVVVFLTPAIPMPLDVIAAFDVQGLAQAPAKLQAMLGEVSAARQTGMCPVGQ